jgi:hypothetical protein
MKIFRTCPCCNHYLGFRFILQIVTMNDLKLTCAHCGKNIGQPIVFFGKSMGLFGLLLGLYMDEIILYLFHIDISNNYIFIALILIVFILVILILYYYLYPLKCNTLKKESIEIQNNI